MDNQMLMKAIKWKLAALLSMLMMIQPATAQDDAELPTIEELEFLLGEWEITFEIYDTRKPERGALIVEKGTQTCRPELENHGTPQFITCIGRVTAAEDSPYQAGRSREFREAISYNRFLGHFERIGQFSNWPSHSEEAVYFHADTRTIEIKGELPVEDGMMERYEDIYTFSDDYTSYQRVNKANFSDMPVTLYNLTLKGTGKKISR